MRRREEGASAVEFAILAPLLFMLLFGIIGFGLAFLQVQSIRTAVREGGRAAAVGQDLAGVQGTTWRASSGSIPNSSDVTFTVQNSAVSQCVPSNIGHDAIVSYDTKKLPQGGVVVHIPLLPDIKMSPVISASFRCEV